MALESNITNDNLNLWIDNIFGCNQLNRNNINIYSKYTYEQEVNLKEKWEKYTKQNLSDEDKIDKIK